MNFEIEVEVPKLTVLDTSLREDAIDNCKLRICIGNNSLYNKQCYSLFIHLDKEQTNSGIIHFVKSNIISIAKDIGDSVSNNNARFFRQINIKESKISLYDIIRDVNEIPINKNTKLIINEDTDYIHFNIKNFDDKNILGFEYYINDIPISQYFY